MHAGYNYESIMPTVNACVCVLVCVSVGKTNAAKTTARRINYNNQILDTKYMHQVYRVVNRVYIYVQLLLYIVNTQSIHCAGTHTHTKWSKTKTKLAFSLAA